VFPTYPGTDNDDLNKFMEENRKSEDIVVKTSKNGANQELEVVIKIFQS